MPRRACDWFNQTMRDLEQAKDSQQAGRHEWACFAAQQAGAKSAKALQLSSGRRSRIYSISEIFEKLHEIIQIPGEIFDKGRMLDNLYIPARYPNIHHQGAPFEHYDQVQSDASISYAIEIINFASARMALNFNNYK